MKSIIVKRNYKSLSVWGFTLECDLLDSKASISDIPQVLMGSFVNLLLDCLLALTAIEKKAKGGCHEMVGKDGMRRKAREGVWGLILVHVRVRRARMGVDALPAHTRKHARTHIRIPSCFGMSKRRISDRWS